MFGRAKSLFGRGKLKQARSKVSSQGLNELDRISKLPDALISQILSHLPTKEAVRTSVLSTRWRSLWLWLPDLELDSQEFPDFNMFKSFGDRFFDTNRVSCIRSLKLYVEVYENVNDASFLKSWIDAAIKRKVQHLEVFSHPFDDIYEVPISLYLCETLVSLTLYKMLMVNVEFVSLPCLKTMYLEYVFYPNEATFERLVSCCPVLDELMIIVTRNDAAKVYRVHSRSLTSLIFKRVSASFQFDSTLGVVIDAPLLNYLKIDDNLSKSFIVNNLEPSAELSLSLDFGLEHLDEANVSSRRSRNHSFLPGISRVRYMTIDADTFKVIHDYSKLEPLPQFPYMSRLFVTLCVSDLECLPTFLGSCPNLKSLSMKLKDDEEMSSEEMNQISYSSVPECFLSSLEFVHFTMPISGYAAEMKLVKYFLESSAALKMLALRVKYDSIGYDFFKKLLRIPRCSTKCQVVI